MDHDDQDTPDCQHPRATSGAGPASYAASGPEDLVALVPICLGFVPHDSLVMLTFPAPGGAAPHARVDLPPVSDLVPDPEPDLDLAVRRVSRELVDVLLAPTLLHRVPRVAFVLYGPASRLTEALADRLVARFGGEGVDVVTVLRVEGQRWFALLPGHPDEHYSGMPFDLEAHPFMAENVLHGRVVLASREEVRLGIAPDPPRIAETQAAIGAGAGRASVGRVAALTRDWECHRRAWTPVEVAAVAQALRRGAARDRAWWGLDRRTASNRVDLWRDVVRRVPEDLVAGPAAVLGVTAWLSGDGALAWCAVDRCRAVEPRHPLAGLVATVLAEAVSPSVATSLWATAGPASDDADPDEGGDAPVSGEEGVA